MTNALCTSLVLKVASRCNLNCTYCYMYNAGDITYLHQPKVMARQTVQAICRAASEHCIRHRLQAFEFIFHGGEPLLAGQSFYRDFVRLAAGSFDPATRIRYSMQTNGVLLDESWCRLLASLDIRIGISLDGDQETNDMHRKDHSGRGSYDHVVSGIRHVQRHPVLNHSLGILCVVDVHSRTSDIYENIKALNIRQFNVLLPYGTHDAPPGILQESIPGATPYADWLIDLFDKWFQDEGRPAIPLFTRVMGLLLGLGSEFDYFGRGDIQYLVVETDGSIEPSGALKVCGNGFTKTGMDIGRYSLDDALATPLIRRYHRSHRRLPDKCRRCPLKEICGGGHLPTRYSRERGFDNPSFYCLDYMKLITYIQSRLWQILPSSVTGKLTRITFEQMKKFHADYHSSRKVYEA